MLSGTTTPSMVFSGVVVGVSGFASSAGWPSVCVSTVGCSPVCACCCAFTSCWFFCSSVSPAPAASLTPPALGFLAPERIGTASTRSTSRWTADCSHSFVGNPASITLCRNSTVSCSCSSVGFLTLVSSVAMRAMIVRLSCTSSCAYAVLEKNSRCSSVGSLTGSNSMISMMIRKPSLNATHRASFLFSKVVGLMTMRGPPGSTGWPCGTGVFLLICVSSLS